MTRIILTNMVPGSSVALAPPDEFHEMGIFGAADEEGTCIADNVPGSWRGHEIEVRVRHVGRLPFSTRVTVPADPYQDLTVTITQMVDRIITPRFSQEARERIQQMPDIRDVLTSNCIRDMLREEDNKFLRAAGACLARYNHPISIPFATCHQPYKVPEHMMEFFAYQTIGAAVGHAGVLGADFS